MNMTIGRNLGGSGRRKLNLLIATCVAALSVSVAIALGTGGVWESGGSSSTAGTSAPALGQSQSQTTFSGAEFLGLGQPGESAAVPDFGDPTLDALWHAEILQVSAAPQNSTSGAAAVTSQTVVEAVRSNEAAPFIDEWDFGSLGLDYLAPTAPHFGTAADAVYAAESAQTRTNPVVLGDALGIGQPGEVTKSVEATLIDQADLGYLGIEATHALGIGQPSEGISAVEAGAYMTALEATLVDPTDFGSLGVESALQQQFGTAADAVYATQGLEVVDPHFGTGADSVSAIEGDYLGIGQPGHGSTLGDPMVGKMVGPVYVIEDMVR